MANENTVFFLEDEAEDLGGFNDPILPVEEEENPEEEPKEDDVPQEKDSEEEPKDEDPEVNPFEEQFNKAMGLVTSQTEQINTLVEQNKTLQNKFAEPEVEQAPEKPVFTQEQWDDDAQACSDANMQYYNDLANFNNKVNTAAQETEQQNKQATMQASHNESWDLATMVMPELADNAKARNAWSAIYYDQGTGFSQDPNGPLKATKALKLHMAKNNLSFDVKETPNTKEAERKGAEDEAARQVRLKNSKMHTGTGESQSKTVNLTAEQKSVCRQMNISEQAYAETLTAMGRQ